MKMNKFAVLMTSCMLFAGVSMQANAAIIKGELLTEGTVSIMVDGDVSVSVTSTPGKANMKGEITTNAAFIVKNTGTLPVNVGLTHKDAANGPIVWKLVGDDTVEWFGGYFITDNIVKWDKENRMVYQEDAIQMGDSATYQLGNRTDGKDIVAPKKPGEYQASLQVYQISL